jgi:hypothetical protein
VCGSGVWLQRAALARGMVLARPPRDGGALAGATMSFGPSRAEMG